MGVNVFLNVYDMTRLNCVLGCMKLAVYHTGVQVYDREYRFGKREDSESGVVCQNKPKESPKGSGLLYKRSIFLGHSPLSASEIEGVLRDLRGKFLGNSYDLFEKNCNHFSNALSLRLVGKEIPSFIFNPSKRLAFTRHFLPKRFVTAVASVAPSSMGGCDEFESGFVQNYSAFVKQKKDSLILGKKRLQNKRTGDIELSLLDTNNNNNNNNNNSNSNCNITSSYNGTSDITSSSW